VRLEDIHTRMRVVVAHPTEEHRREFANQVGVVTAIYSYWKKPVGVVFDYGPIAWFSPDELEAVNNET